MPVHLYGHPAAMDRIMAIAERHGLAVVEDAAQAHGAALNGRPVGAFGTAGCFSFYPTKNMHSLEGGMITTADAELARTLRLLRNQGMEQRYANEIVGANMRMTDVAAAIGRVQLRQLPEWTEQRRANAKFLDAGDHRAWSTPPVADGRPARLPPVHGPGAGRPRRRPAAPDRAAASATPSTTRRRSTASSRSWTSTASRARGTCRRPSAPPPRWSRCRCTRR